MAVLLGKIDNYYSSLRESVMLCIKIENKLFDTRKTNENENTKILKDVRILRKKLVKLFKTNK
jgi:hypothetical protein